MVQDDSRRADPRDRERSEGARGSTGRGRAGDAPTLTVRGLDGGIAYNGPTMLGLPLHVWGWPWGAPRAEVSIGEKLRARRRALAGSHEEIARSPSERRFREQSTLERQREGGAKGGRVRTHPEPKVGDRFGVWKVVALIGRGVQGRADMRLMLECRHGVQRPAFEYNARKYVGHTCAWAHAPRGPKPR